MVNGFWTDKQRLFCHLNCTHFQIWHSVFHHLTQNNNLCNALSRTLYQNSTIPSTLVTNNKTTVHVYTCTCSTPGFHSPWLIKSKKLTKKKEKQIFFHKYYLENIKQNEYILNIYLCTLFSWKSKKLYILHKIRESYWTIITCTGLQYQYI